ncbi:MAG: translationally-controlled tumor protein [Cyanosarcina radialis HA8281-LM2]|jgi:hypothetical protein|nr:translationally-controlled tumor protein [Cyanosarcina radialis HA8281-LM2]
MNFTQKLTLILGVTTLLPFIKSPSAYAAPQCAASNQIPLSKARLDVLAVQKNAVDPNLIPTEFNKKVGKAFQDFALGTIDPNRVIPENTIRYYSKLRDENTNGKKKNVAPDAVVPLIYKDILTGQEKEYPEGVFYEVKALGAATKVSITPRSDEWQIGGEVQVLSDSDAAKMWGNGVPALIFLTTSDVKISPKLRIQATLDYVALWHGIACEIPTFGGNAPDNYLQLGRADLNNPEVYVLDLTIPAPIGPGKPGKLPELSSQCYYPLPNAQVCYGGPP